MTKRKANMPFRLNSNNSLLTNFNNFLTHYQCHSEYYAAVNIKVLQQPLFPIEFIYAAFPWESAKQGNIPWARLDSLWQKQCSKETFTYTIYPYYIINHPQYHTNKEVFTSWLKYYGYLRQYKKYVSIAAITKDVTVDSYITLIGNFKHTDEGYLFWYNVHLKWQIYLIKNNII